MSASGSLSPIRAVSFDLDGTLIDSTEAIVESFFHTFDTLQVQRPPQQAVVDSIGHTLEDQFRLFGIEDADAAAAIYRAYYIGVCCEKTFLLPGATESLARLRAAGLAVGLATSKMLSYAELILEHLGVLDAFEVRIGPLEVARQKPHPDAVLKSAELLGVDTSELLFVGDTHFDVLAAQAADVRCVCVTTGYATREALEALQPEAVYDTLEEVTQHALRAAQ